MKADSNLLDEIKKRVRQTEPDAKIILYGSYARGDANEESDIDLLILINKKQLNYEENYENRKSSLQSWIGYRFNY